MKAGNGCMRKRIAMFAALLMFLMVGSLAASTPIHAEGDLKEIGHLDDDNGILTVFTFTLKNEKAGLVSIKEKNSERQTSVVFSGEEWHTLLQHWNDACDKAAAAANKATQDAEWEALSNMKESAGSNRCTLTLMLGDQGDKTKLRFKIDDPKLGGSLTYDVKPGEAGTLGKFLGGVRDFLDK